MLNKLPNLLIVGAAKSGTTSLHNYLNQHPDIFMSSHKEPHFLINKEIGEKRIPNGIINIEEYSQLFKGYSNKKYRGESSVMYLLFPEITIANIKKYLSDDVKIIIMLRNPVERAYSGYQHVKRYNTMELLSFKDAVEKSENRYFKNKNMTPASRYLELGMYYDQVKEFSEAFTNIHVIIYDAYKADFNSELQKVFKFLEIDSVVIDAEEKYMVGGWQWKNEWLKHLMIKKNLFKSIVKLLVPFKKLRKWIRVLIQHKNTIKVNAIDLNTEQWLKTYYKGDVEKLSKLLDVELNHWTK
tara:strand:+ start:861 stop:1754 length:894 start_codon:yes stop_codon:yes gene_type:complete